MFDEMLSRERVRELSKADAKEVSALPKQAAETPRDQALRTFHKNEALDAAEKASLRGVVHKAGGREPIEVPEARGNSSSSDGVGSPMRFRDFNPDERMAMWQQVEFKYDSRRNSIVAPRLRLETADGGYASGSELGGQSLGGDRTSDSLSSGRSERISSMSSETSRSAGIAGGGRGGSGSGGKKENKN